MTQDEELKEKYLQEKRVTDFNNEILRKQDIRLKCLEIAARMIGPLAIKENQTPDQILDQYASLSYSIEFHVTRQHPLQADPDF